MSEFLTPVSVPLKPSIIQVLDVTYRQEGLRSRAELIRIAINFYLEQKQKAKVMNKPTVNYH